MEIIEEQRREVVAAVISREGKNQYTQGHCRTQVAGGFSDCSSLQEWAYQQVGIEIGNYTGAQILKGVTVTSGGIYPEESLLKPGDELFFAESAPNGRPYQVSHIEMYVGDGMISGHNFGMGPVRKDLVAYCEQRQKENRPYILVKRYLVDEDDILVKK